MYKVSRRRTITIERDADPYYVTQGWTERRKGWFGSASLHGFYRTPYGSYEGEVIDGPSPKFYIIRPPEELRRHSHWICFTGQGNGRYNVHFSTRPRDIDSGIQQIERILNESFRDY